MDKKQEFQFGSWRVFPSENVLQNGEKEVKLDPKAMALLLVLAESSGQVVSRDEIFAKVWKHQIIADHVLYNVIAVLRKALEVDPKHPQLIKTVPKKGYILDADVKWIEQTISAKVKEKHPSKTTVNKLPIVFASLILLTFVVFWLGFKNTPSNDEVTNSDALYPASIAVLPFSVFDDEQNTKFFADGLVEEIIHQLSSTPNLTVVSRSSSFAFQNQQLEPQKIAEKLGVVYLIEGSIRKDHDQLRINVNLVNAANNHQIWSRVFSTSMSNVFQLQQDISTSVLYSLSPDKSAIEPFNFRDHPQSSDAYMHYLRGNAMASRGTVDFLKKAIVEFENAIALYPDYALAHVSLALNTMVLFQYRQIGAEEAQTIATEAIADAKRLDPMMAEAMVAEGLMNLYFNRFEKAKAAFIKALEVDPTLGIAHHNYGYLLWLSDEHSVAIKHFSEALTRNPMSAITNFAVADSYFVTGQVELALNQFKHCISLLPDYPACQLGIANVYRAIEMVELSEQHMKNAQKQLSAGDIYWQVASLMDDLWKGDIDNAFIKQEKIQLRQGRGYYALQMKALSHALSGQTDLWLQKLTSLNEKYPTGIDLKVVSGFTHYYLGDCDSALSYYESVLTANPLLRGQFNISMWGISHIANMAYCYQKLGIVEKEQMFLEQFSNQLSQYNKNDMVVDGLELLNLKFQLIRSPATDVTDALEALSQKKSAYRWLIENDPQFQKASLKVGSTKSSEKI